MGQRTTRAAIPDGRIDHNGGTTLEMLLAAIVSPAKTGTEYVLYSYDVEATDPDVGDILTFSLDVFPAGMTIDGVTGLVEWTPINTQVGGNGVTVRVTDGGGLFDTQGFTIGVATVNNPPVITSVPETAATQGQLYIDDVKATDPDLGDNLTFSLDLAPMAIYWGHPSNHVSWVTKKGAGAPIHVGKHVESQNAL